MRQAHSGGWLASSLGEESFSLNAAESGGLLLEYPSIRGRAFLRVEIPPVLLSGDHKKIADWRRNEAEAITRARRPDLLCRRSYPADNEE
ncbi:MAG: hypothetical protein R3C40_02105 [Parvularculaceae bacterium]